MSGEVGYAIAHLLMQAKCLFCFNPCTTPKDLARRYLIRDKRFLFTLTRSTAADIEQPPVFAVHVLVPLQTEPKRHTNIWKINTGLTPY